MKKVGNTAQPSSKFVLIRRMTQLSATVPRDEPARYTAYALRYAHRIIIVSSTAIGHTFSFTAVLILEMRLG